VKHCGLAVGQGVWSSLIVIISFSWGIFFFNEKVNSLLLACLGVLVMCVGIWGMSIFSVPAEQFSGSADGSSANNREVPFINDSNSDDAYLNKLLDGNAHTHSVGNQTNSNKVIKEHKPTDMTTVFGFPCTRRTAGLIAALFNGTWGGSIMVPFQWAPEGTSGLQYLTSFACGAAIVTFSCWVGLFFYNYFFDGGDDDGDKSLMSAYRKLPYMNFRIMWLPGFTAGTLWSIGNVCR